MKKLKVLLPKGKLYKNVVKLLNETGFQLEISERSYRPWISDPEMEVKILKPQNIPTLVALGTYDLGFVGYDWVVETRADVVEVLDLELDTVRIVAAIPKGVRIKELRNRKIVVASEYEYLARTFLDREKYDYIFFKSYGATEVFPPDDAEMIIDNTTTEATLKEHNLRIIATLLESSTRLITNKDVLKDAWKSEKLRQLKLLFQSVFDAAKRVMLEMNVSQEKLEAIVKILPCMRAPTIAPLYGGQGYAIKVAVKRDVVAKLIPHLKKLGATDILEFEFKKVIV